MRRCYNRITGKPEYNRTPAGTGKEKKMYNIYEITFRDEEGTEVTREIVATGICPAITEAAHKFYMECGLMSLDFTPVKAEQITFKEQFTEAQ